MRLVLLVAIIFLVGCTKTQEVFDRELFIACVQASGDQYNGVYECRRTATTYKEED